MLTKIGMLGYKLVVTHASQLWSCNYYVCVCALLLVCVCMCIIVCVCAYDFVHYI